MIDLSWEADPENNIVVLGELMHLYEEPAHDEKIKKRLEKIYKLTFNRPINIEDNCPLFYHSEESIPMFKFEFRSENNKYLVRVGYEEERVARLACYKKRTEDTCLRKIAE